MSDEIERALKLLDFAAADVSADSALTYERIRHVQRTIRAALAKREAVADGVVWQARVRGCEEWSDVSALHAERLRTCSWLVRGIVVVSPESDAPIAERNLLAASQQAKEVE